MPDVLSPELLRKLHAHWRAVNYLSVGQICLQDNPLLESPLRPQHIKSRLLGHWGTTSGLNLLYVHLSRLIKDNAGEPLPFRSACCSLAPSSASVR
jgi:xylulose-5-phosphate/fructose-6-phosphate phosphoketolase